MDYEQLSKYFSGEMISKEKEEFFTSLSSDADKLEETARLKNIWASVQMSSAGSDKKVAGRGWKIFRKHIGRKNDFSWWRAASVILLLCTVGAASYFLGHRAYDTIPVAYHTLSVPAGQYAQLKLSDGSEIWLNSRSTLIYPERFDSDTREVQFEGEGFFRVQSDKEHPFVVKTKEMDIIATGTEFNISAYEDDERVSATLIEGKVTLSSQKNGIDWLLEKNKMIIYSKENNQIMVKPVDALMQITWTHGEFSFRDLPMEDITKRLERNFNVKFIFETPGMKQRVFTGTFYNHQSIESILKVIETSTDRMKYQIKNDTIFIK